MSEQNILNPTASSVMNPNYSIAHKDPAIISSWQARSGKPFSRNMLARGMEFQLHWDKVPFSTYQSLRQWFRQYEQDFFSYFDIDDSRYYSGQFLAEPQYERAGNNMVNVSATFVAIPTLPLFAYPSNWGVDSIFLEERNGFGADLVKLTGTWDHGDKNYCLFSEQFDNAAWEKVNCTVVANSVTDPNGGATADAVTFSVSGSTGQIRQHMVAPFPVAGRNFTFSGWIKVPAGTQTIHLLIGTQTFGLTPVEVTITATTAWQRFSVSGTVPATVTQASALFYNPGAATTYHIWGAQFEFGSVATTYTQTTATAVALIAPSADANLHGNGFSYFDAGTVTTDAAEWIYVGYGFRLWSSKGPDMGIIQIFLDGVTQTFADLYSATSVPSSVIWTSQSVVLGQHRVKILATNAKNAASINFVIAADAIEVMR